MKKAVLDGSGHNKPQSNKQGNHNCCRSTIDQPDHILVINGSKQIMRQVATRNKAKTEENGGDAKPQDCLEIKFHYFPTQSGLCGLDQWILAARKAETLFAPPLFLAEVYGNRTHWRYGLRAAQRF